MAKKIKLTRPELKRQREMLARFERYLPMLKLKQQQLQLALRQLEKERRAVEAECLAALKKFEAYSGVLRDVSGVNVEALSACRDVKTTSVNIAGVTFPMFEEAVFPDTRYSLFATPVWVDAAIRDLREVNLKRVKLELLDEQKRLLGRELKKIIQRVNLFEKVKIPESREAMRIIRIHLGDEMTAGVGRAKLAKGKLEQEETDEASWA